MFPSENLDVLTALCACFLNSHEFVRLNCLEISVLDRADLLDKMAEMTAFQLYRKAPFLTERQRAETIKDFFDKNDSYTDLFLYSLERVSKKFVYLCSGKMRFRSEGTLEWVECYSSLISTIPLMAHALSQNLSRSKAVGAGIIREVFRDPIIPLPDDPFLKEHIQKGFSEIHMHYANSSHPFHVWDQAINNPTDWINLFSSNKQQKQIWQYLLPHITGMEMARWLHMAKIIREWLVCWILEYYPAHEANSLESCAAIIENNCINPTFILQNVQTCLTYFTHPAEKLTAFSQNDSALVLEGALWTMSLKKLRDEPANGSATKMLHLYHLFSTIVLKLSVHQLFFTGFDLFDSLAQSPLREATEDMIHQENIRQIILSGSLRKIEFRVAGKEDQEQFIENKLAPIIKTLENGNESVFPDENKNESKIENFNFGIICHFIKKPDSLRKLILGQNVQLLTTPRHVELRHSLIVQAETFLRTRNGHKYGKYLIGIDGAGSEFVAPPEVFASVYNHMMYEMTLPSIPDRPDGKVLPELRYTFHAGEDFYHLITGIRTIVEAIKFLKLPKGSRLGHCVALGIPPDWWLTKNNQVRMPRQQRLDDLVWLLKFIDDHSTRTIIDAEICHLSSEIYGKPYSPHSLLRAWRWRYLPFSQFERSLPSQQQTLRSLIKKGYLDKEWNIRNLEVNQIVQNYHFDMKCFEKGEKIIVVDHPTNNTSKIIAKAIAQAQEYVKRLLNKRQIAIETCPSSNLRISQIDTLDDHPIFQWQPSENHADIDLHPLIATDNPGFCQTSIPLEYCAIKQAAIRRYKKQDRELSQRQLQRWINTIIDDTNTFSFLN